MRIYECENESSQDVYIDDKGAYDGAYDDVAPPVA